MKKKNRHKIHDLEIENWLGFGKYSQRQKMISGFQYQKAN